MKELIEIKTTKNKTLRIMYDLGNLCNYKCWYCFPGSNEGTTGWPDVNIVKHNVVRMIQYYFENGIDDINLNLLGGEPTLWKDLSEFVEHIKLTVKPKFGQKLRISMQTNGSRTLRWWEEYGQYFDNVSISVHNERADPNHIAKVAQTLTDKGVFAFASVLMDHKNWDRSLQILNEILSIDAQFMVEAMPVHLDGIYDYSEEQKEFFKSPVKRKPSLKCIVRHYRSIMSIPVFTGIFSDGSIIKTKSAQHFTVNGYDKFKGWSCNLGVNWVFINRQGNLTGTCENKIYGINSYYNINDLDFIGKYNPIIKPTTCDKTQCLCQGEVVLSKKKI
jgi:organic radical activating enzyme